MVRIEGLCALLGFTVVCIEGFTVGCMEEIHCGMD